MTKRIETAPPPTSYDRWCGEGPKRRPTKRTRSQTIIRTRCLNWLKFKVRRAVLRSRRPAPGNHRHRRRGTCDSWCDSATSDNRRSAGAGQERKQLGASYPGFRGGSAPVQVLPMSAVFRTFRSFGARSTRMRNPRVCQNTEPAKDRSTGHGTPDRTGPLTSTL